MSTTVGGAAAVLSIVALSAGAAGAAQGPRIGMSYEAGPSCPDGANFARLVNRQAPAIELAPIELERAEVFVALRAENDGFNGSLRIRRGDARTYVREMSGVSCNDVGSALAFVAALALSGQESSLAEAPPAESTATPPPIDQPTMDAAPAATRTWGWGVGAGLGMRTGIAPTWANTERILVEVRSIGDALVAPSFQAAFLHAETVTRIDRAGSTEFSWSAARLAGCPLRLRSVSTLEIVPCAGTTIGSIGASGAPTSTHGRGYDSRSVWADAFASVRLQLHVVGPLFAAGEAEIVFPLTRYTFAFDPGTPVYGIPVAAGAGAIVLFAQFP